MHRVKPRLGPERMRGASTAKLSKPTRADGAAHGGAHTAGVGSQLSVGVTQRHRVLLDGPPLAAARRFVANPISARRAEVFGAFRERLLAAYLERTPSCARAVTLAAACAELRCAARAAP